MTRRAGRVLAAVAVLAMSLAVVPPAVAAPRGGPASTPASAASTACPGQASWDDPYTRPAEFGQVATTNVPIEMSDGVTLYADVVVPDAEGPFPTIVTQTAYSKDVLGGPVAHFVPRGYAVLTVDLRGTGTSEGRWDPFGERERRDGFEVFEWVVDQPWSNGRTAGYGASYLGLTQIFSAAQHPEGLEAIFPIVPVADAYRDIVLMGGQLNVGFMPLWVSLVTALSAAPGTRWADDPAAAMQTAVDHLLRVADPDSAVALLAKAALGDAEVVYDTEFWQQRSPINHVDRVQVPTFVTGGLNDLFQRGEPLLYEALRGQVPTKLLMGPWGHIDGSSGAGLVDAGLPAIEDIALRWFDNYLMDIDTRIACIPDVTQWHWGAEGYRTQPDWPHPDLAPLPLFLGDGTLQAQPPTDAGRELLPPVPVAGACSRSTSQWLMGALDRTPCAQDNRLNELVEVQWTTPPLPEDVVVNGPINARLWLESSGAESVVVVRVTDVAPDGTSRELTNGLQAGSFRALDPDRSRVVDGWMLQPYHPFTASSVEPMPAGQAVPVDVEVFSTAAVVEAGHRIRVSVGAADFPHAVSPLPDLATVATATTRVAFGPDTPSHVVLPVVGAAGDATPAPGPVAGPGDRPDPAPADDGGTARDAAAPLPATGGTPASVALLVLLLAGLGRTGARAGASVGRSGPPQAPPGGSMRSPDQESPGGRAADADLRGGRPDRPDHA